MMQLNPQSLKQRGPTAHILVVEDDVPLANYLKKRLEAEAYGVEVASDGEVGYGNVQQSHYDLLILDLNLPKLDGVALLKQIRPLKPRLPVLVLTARNRIEDRVLSLDTGADDCVLKPFSFFELAARVRALLRRQGDLAINSVQVADLVLDREQLFVKRAGRSIHLTAREFDVLEYLMKNAGRTVTRNMIMEAVWRLPFDPCTNLVDVYVKYVRDKVDANCPNKLIRTVRGAGYILSES